MKAMIEEKLCEIEKKENLKILFAVESGSRAWGFESENSDYDVRFIYIRPAQWYLRLDERRDVVEEPIDKLLDVSGWDLEKALKLLYRSNAAVLEWTNSPIVYRTTPFAIQFQKTAETYFQIKASAYHYLNMAKGNYRNYLKCDMVKAKKYFYVLRPLLACKWVLEQGCLPPVLFTELAAHQLEGGPVSAVNQLLELKKNGGETREIPQIQELNTYIEKSLEKLEEKAAAFQEKRINSWEPLNELFLSALKLWE